TPRERSFTGKEAVDPSVGADGEPGEEVDAVVQRPARLEGEGTEGEPSARSEGREERQVGEAGGEEKAREELRRRRVRLRRQPGQASAEARRQVGAEGGDEIEGEEEGDEPGRPHWPGP